MAPSWLAPLSSLIPSNLQKRLLSYALTHVLGTFLEPQTFSLENLELQLLNGSVTLRNLDINTSKLNSLLPLPGLEILGGRIEQVNVQVPVRDVVSGRISIKIHSVQVILRPSLTPYDTAVPHPPVPDLTPDALAQSFLQSSINDPTDSVLLDTLSESIHSANDIGLGPTEEEGMFTSVLAAFVETLKSRLVIDIQDLNLHVQHPRSGAFILALSHLSFVNQHDNPAERVLTLKNIEAYLLDTPTCDDDDNDSVGSQRTISPPSPSDATHNHGLSESMIFSSHEAGSLYMSAYSHASQSNYADTGHPQLSLPSVTEDDTSANKGFRFFYFEDDLKFHIITPTSSDPVPVQPVISTPKFQSLSIVKSTIPTANLILHPDVNLLPSISLISTILSLSTAIPSPPEGCEAPDDDVTYEIDISLLGGLIVHFGPENAQAKARLTDCQVKRKIGEGDLTISMGVIDVISSSGDKVLSLGEASKDKSSRRLNLVVGPNSVEVSLPEVDVHLDLDGVKAFQPLIHAMKHAWMEVPESGTTPASHSVSVAPENDYSDDDEEWNENLLVEQVPTTSQARLLNLTLHRLTIILPTDNPKVNALALTIDDLSLRVLAEGRTSIEFSSAKLMLDSVPLLCLSSLSKTKALIDLLMCESSASTGMKRTQTQEILDDFLVGEGIRSDDAWGIIRADAMNESNLTIRMRLSMVDVHIQDHLAVAIVKGVVKQLLDTVEAFVEPRPQSVEMESSASGMIVEFSIGEGRARVQLDKEEVLEDAVSPQWTKGNIGIFHRELTALALADCKDLGYALCATMPTGNACLRFLFPGPWAGIDVEDVSIQLDTCADSTQTLADVFSNLKPPIEIEEGRYQSGENDSMNILQDIDENAFGSNFDAKEVTCSDGDFVSDDVPFNLAFIESYYGDPSKPKPGPASGAQGDFTEEHADELLAEGEDIGHFAEPPTPALPVDKGKFGEFEEQIRILDNSPVTGKHGSVRFVDEHFPAHSLVQEGRLLSSDSVVKVKLRNARVVWNLHDGYDWPRTRDAIAVAVEKVEQRAAEALAAKARRRTTQPTRTVTLPDVLYGDDPWTFDEEGKDDLDNDSEIGDILFNSIYVGVRKGQDPRSLAQNINRDLDDQSETTSQISTTPSSPIRASRGASPGYAIGHSHDGARHSTRLLRLKRSKSQKVQINLRSLALDFQLLSEPVEPGQTVLSTLRLRVGDFEILDNVPTSSWNKFVTSWRGGDKRRRETASPMVDIEVVNVKPVLHLSASEFVIKAKVLPLKLHVDQDTLDFITRFFEFKDQSAIPINVVVPEPPFLQRVDVYPVNVMLDYKPKKVDYAGLRSGRTTEFMNFFTLEEAEILLRRVTLYGISGFPKLFQKLNDIWMPDIRGNQLLEVLGGINYVRPFANIGGGIKDLIVVPMKEYHKDGRFLQGTGKGILTFGKTLTNEIVKVGAKVAVSAQKGLEWGEELIEGKPTTVSSRGGVRFDDDDIDSDMEGDACVVKLSPYADQPANIKQGIKRAIESLVRNAKSAGETVIAIPQEVAESGSAAGAGKTVLKAIPVAIIRPLIGASGAVSNTLMGIHNSLDSNQQRNLEDVHFSNDAADSRNTSVSRFTWDTSQFTTV